MIRFVVFLMFFVTLFSGTVFPDEKKITITLINTLDKEYCVFNERVEATEYKNWLDFVSSGKKEVTENAKKNAGIIFAETVPEQILINRSFITIRTWKDIPCPANNACSNDSGRIIILDAKTLKVIETPASKRYKDECYKTKK
jgi:hypothetical protein